MYPGREEKGGMTLEGGQNLTRFNYNEMKSWSGGDKGKHAKNN